MSEIRSNEYFSPQAFASKVFSLYNISQIAMSTYVNNIKNFLDQRIPPKIVDLLCSIQMTTIICVERMLFDEDDYVVQVRLSNRIRYFFMLCSRHFSENLSILSILYLFFSLYFLRTWSLY